MCSAIWLRFDSVRVVYAHTRVLHTRFVHIASLHNYALTHVREDRNACINCAVCSDCRHALLPSGRGTIRRVVRLRTERCQFRGRSSAIRYISDNGSFAACDNSIGRTSYALIFGAGRTKFLASLHSLHAFPLKHSFFSTALKSHLSVRNSILFITVSKRIVLR